MINEPDLYTYRAVIVSVYDGDTVRADIDLGCNIWIRNEPLRLYGINAPEVRGESRADGLKVRDYLAEFIAGKPVFIRTYKDKKGKYGRWLAEIFLETTAAELVNVNTWLVVNGYAEKAEY